MSFVVGSIRPAISLNQLIQFELSAKRYFLYISFLSSRQKSY